MNALLVDALNLIRRIHAAIPVENEPDGEAKQLESAIYSTKRSLRRALNFHQPSHCIAVFEEGGQNWRHSLFPPYKKNRKTIPKNLHQALTQYQDTFKDIGVGCFSFYGFEADDVIATLATKLAQHEVKVVILSTDRLQCQMMSDSVRIYDHFQDTYISEDIIRQKFDVEPEQLVDLYALAGDAAQSITGIRSVGMRTAAKLIHDYGNLESILEKASNIPGKLGSKISNGANDARLAKKLFSLRTDLNLGINLHSFRYQPSTL